MNMKTFIFLLLFHSRLAHDDEDEDADERGRMASKWSSPVMQKQRMAYMDNLNARKRSSRYKNSDQFNEK